MNNIQTENRECGKRKKKSLAILRICYIFINMIKLIARKYRLLIAGGLIIAQWVALFFAPWFHQHPGQGHAEGKGDAYHAHAVPFTSHVPEFDKDRHDPQEGLHLLQGSRPFDTMQGLLEAHFGKIITPCKFASHVDFSGLLSAAISPPAFIVKTIFKFLPLQAPLDYFVLTATGLSPPLA